jgi:cyclopropane-fatty-acyl-phospholipid synthase
VEYATRPARDAGTREMVDRYREKLEQLLGHADIRIDGGRSWDPQVHRPEFYSRVLGHGTLGLGEAWMEGWWDCRALDELVARAWAAELPRKIRAWRDMPRIIQARLFNLQHGRRAFRIGEHHYDIGEELYRRMLGPTMVYSCGYWKNAASLDAAQLAKLDLVCRKLQLEPGQRVLDIGCGWGTAARHAAEKYGVEVVGITVSRRQAEYARTLNRGLPVEIRLADYRELNESFDRIFSIGMFEHVGYRNYRIFFRTVRRCLTAGGLFLLHTIGSPRSLMRTDPWVSRYIFPNSMLPSARQICASAEGLMVIAAWHNFGADYDYTLMSWFHNIEGAWQELDDTRYDQRFRRMWRFYLLSCAGGFRAREMQLWQIVFSPEGIPGGYRVENIR